MLKRFFSKSKKISNNVILKEAQLMELIEDYTGKLHDKYENDSKNESYLKEVYKAGRIAGQVVEISTFRKKFRQGKIPNVPETLEKIDNAEKFVNRNVEVYKNKLAEIK